MHWAVPLLNQSALGIHTWFFFLLVVVINLTPGSWCYVFVGRNAPTMALSVKSDWYSNCCYFCFLV